VRTFKNHPRGVGVRNLMRRLDTRSDERVQPVEIGHFLQTFPNPEDGTANRPESSTICLAVDVYPTITGGACEAGEWCRSGNP